MNTNFIEGLTLLGLGMGFVLCFLCILILSMHIMSGIVAYLNKIFPELVEVSEKKSISKSSGDDSAAIALAIALAAIKRK